MKEYIFNKKDYKNYQDFYKDLAIKMESIECQDYYDTSTFDFNPNILWELKLKIKWAFLPNSRPIIGKIK